MGQKAKFILVGLIGVSLIFLALYIYTLRAKQLIQQERDNLKNENVSLSSKIYKLESNLRDNENKISSLNKELERVSREKEEIEKKYELANKAKDELVARLKAQQTQVARPPQEQALPQTTDAYWAEILKAKTDLELQLGNVRKELKTMQISNEELQRENGALALDVNNLKWDKEDLNRQLGYNQKLMDSIAQELVRERSDKMKIQDSLKLIKNENTILVRQLKSLNSRKINLERKLEQLQEEKVGLERSVTDMETMLTSKVSEASVLKGQLEAIPGGTKAEMSADKKESVELPPIVVRPQPETSTPETNNAIGTVLTVNRENNFVIIDSGEDTGIRIGNTFQVYRQGERLATVEVIKTSRTVAACDIKKEIKPIKIGDTIR